MEKIINYISHGKGSGIKFLLLLSLVLAIFYAVDFKYFGDTLLSPAMQKAADVFLPLKIENGEVTEPKDTFKTYDLVVGQEGDAEAKNINLVMDTSTDYLETAGLKQGLYLTKRAFYTVTDNQIRVYNLENSSYFPQGDYTDMFKHYISWVSFFVGLFGFAVLFVFYLIAVLFYAYCAYGIAAIFRKKYTFDLRMRLSSLAFIATSIVFIILDWFGFSNGWFFLLAVLALQTLVIKDLPEQESKVA